MNHTSLIKHIPEAAAAIICGTVLSLTAVSAAVQYDENGEPYIHGGSGSVFSGYREYTGVTKEYGTLPCSAVYGNISVNAASDDEKITFTFTDNDSGSVSEYSVMLCTPRKVYFPGEKVQAARAGLNWDKTGDNFCGELYISMSVSKITGSDREYSFSAETVTAFSANGNNGEKFAFIPDHYSPEKKTHTVDFGGAFPDAPENEDVPLWTLFEVTDGKDIHCYIASEYRYNSGEYTVPPEDMSWVRSTGGYYDGSVGVIEYHNDRSLLLLTGISAAVLAAAAIIVFGIVKAIKKKKNDG